MLQFYNIGKLKPLNATEVSELQQSAHRKLPFDYLTFLLQQGYGDIQGMLSIPPASTIGSAFGEIETSQLWDITPDEAVQLKNSPLILTTIDGDSVAIGLNAKMPYMILPRASEVPVYHATLDSVIKYHQQRYSLPDKPYFDPDSGYQAKTIELSKADEATEEIYDRVHNKFIQLHFVDKTYKTNHESKYILQRIGGWICFDDRSKNLVHVKYQSDFKNEAEELINFISKASSARKRMHRGI